MGRYWTSPSNPICLKLSTCSSLASRLLTEMMLGEHLCLKRQSLNIYACLDCRTIQYEQLIRGLAMCRFQGGDALKPVFDRVDVDRSGSLEFSEVCINLVRQQCYELFMIWNRSILHSFICGLRATLEALTRSLVFRKIQKSSIKQCAA